MREQVFRPATLRSGRFRRSSGDGSLGCPQPGMNYVMMITPGYLIMLEANGQAYEYHTSMNGVVWCKEPEAPYSVGPNP